ncbi:MAG: SLBB domain-containing protein, partial [Synechocystis sp.]|nr:SLBB domain-containing protein [Synechocystis sp.]
MVISRSILASKQLSLRLTSATLGITLGYFSIFPSVVVAQNTALIPPRPAAILPSDTEYTLGPGDRLRMDALQVEGLSGEYQVLVDGTVGFPMIGMVNVNGKTIPQVNRLLIEKYSQYIKRPIITVILLEPRPLSITLSGEVNSPGAYTLSADSGKFPNLTQIIEGAGGLTPAADISQITVRRQQGEEEETFRLNLWELLQRGDRRQNIVLRDGDVVIIPSKATTDPDEVRQLADANFGIRFEQEINVAVVGEIFRPGAYKISPTVRASSLGEVGGGSGGSNSLNAAKTQPIRLTQAIQEAGGIKSQADIRNVEVRRENRNGDLELIVVNLWELLDEGNLDKDVILKNGDVITVPQAATLSPEEFEAVATANFSPRTITVNVVGEVRGAGAKQLPPNSTLNQAILAAGSFDPIRADTASVNLIRLNPDGTVTKMDIEPDFSLSISSDRNPTLRNNDVVL